VTSFVIFLRQVLNKIHSHLFCIHKNALVNFNENEQQDVECEIVIKDSVNQPLKCLVHEQPHHISKALIRDTVCKKD